MSTRSKTYLLFWDFETTGLDQPDILPLETSATLYDPETQKRVWSRTFLSLPISDAEYDHGMRFGDLPIQRKETGDARTLVALARHRLRGEVVTNEYGIEVGGDTLEEGARDLAVKTGLMDDLLNMSLHSHYRMADIENIVLTQIARLEAECGSKVRVVLYGLGTSEYDRPIIAKKMPRLHARLYYRGGDLSSMRNTIRDHLGIKVPASAPWNGETPHRAEGDVDLAIRIYEWFQERLMLLEDEVAPDDEGDWEHLDIVEPIQQSDLEDMIPDLKRGSRR